ncbi:MAG TPA: ABC transporter substrate-binding protein [Actinomycetota bacterium]|nr:ABC transporter substrate-binding protein [Actinomycetota bacterium]
MGDEVDRQLHQYLLDRRRFLALGGGTALAGLLAACGLSSSSSSTPGTAAPTSLPPVGGDLNLYVWEGYDIPDPSFKKWLDSQNITEHTKFITQPEEVPTVLKGPGGDKWDMSYGDNVVLSYYKELGLLTPMTVDQVPGLNGLMSAFQSAPWKNDDGTYNGVPWTWGFTGLTYNVDNVPAPKSWNDILDPSYQGRVSTIDGAMNNVATASIAVGIDPDTMTTDQLNGPIKDWLVKMKGQIRALAPSIGDQISLLVSGDVDYMVCGLTFMDAEAAAKGVTTKTVVPSEGAIGWADTTFITPTAPNPQNAYAFANHLLDPKANATANSALLQGPGVQAAIPMLSADAKALYPFNDIDNYLNNTLTFNTGWPHEPDGDRATYDQVIATWEAVKGS